MSTPLTMPAPVPLPRPGWVSALHARLEGWLALLPGLAILEGWLPPVRPLGWRRAHPGIVIGPRGEAFLDQLAARVPDVEIVVTGGQRSPRSQAEAMAAKLRQGQDLTRLYTGAALLAEVLDAAGRSHLTSPDVGAMAEAIGDQVDAGHYLSDHLRPDYALDLRTRGLSTDQVRRLRWHAGALGAHTLLEAVPPHLHLEDLPPLPPTAA